MICPHKPTLLSIIESKAGVYNCRYCKTSIMVCDPNTEWDLYDVIMCGLGVILIAFSDVLTRGNCIEVLQYLSDYLGILLPIRLLRVFASAVVVIPVGIVYYKVFKVIKLLCFKKYYSL